MEKNGRNQKRINTSYYTLALHFGSSPHFTIWNTCEVSVTSKGKLYETAEEAPKLSSRGTSQLTRGASQLTRLHVAVASALGLNSMALWQTRRVGHASILHDVSELATLVLPTATKS